MSKAGDLIRDFSEQGTSRCVNLGDEQQCTTGCMYCEEHIISPGSPCPYTGDFEECPCFRQDRPYKRPWEAKRVREQVRRLDCKYLDQHNTVAICSPGCLAAGVEPGEECPFFPSQLLAISVGPMADWKDCPCYSGPWEESKTEGRTKDKD